MNKFASLISHSLKVIAFSMALSAFAATSTEKTVDKGAEQRTLNMIDFLHEYDLNPHTAAYTSEAQLMTALYEGLYSYNPITLEPVPALAESYKVSRSRKRWTFTIRKNAKFSDGSAITASSIRDSWLTLLANPNASYSSLFDCIEGAEEYRTGKGKKENVAITAKNATTLIVVLNSPAPHFQRLLCHHSFSVVSAKPNVYSGAFVLKSYEDGILELEKNAKYWDSANVALPAIHIEQSGDPDENTFAFNTGAVDWVTGNIEPKSLINTKAVSMAAEYGTQYLFFKCQNEPWNIAEFRQALLAAAPWSELRSKAVVAAETLIYPISMYPSVIGYKDTDIDEALDLMKKARKKAGIPDKKEIEITLALSEEESETRFYDALSAAWKPLGVKVVLQRTPVENYLANIKNWNADIFLYSWIGDFAEPLAFLELFRSDSKLRETNWTNSDFDSLLQKASEISDTVERYKVFASAEQLLLDEAVIMPLSHPVSFHIIDTNIVGGWYSNALDVHPFKYLYLKKPQISVQNLVLAKPDAFSRTSIR